jgi:hypothetical protein
MPTREAVKTTSSNRSTLRPALLAAVLAAIALCCSCADRTDHNSYFQDRVNALRGRTVPSDAIVANDSGLTLSAYSATAHWEFETNEERKVYLSWLSLQLEHDEFKLKSSDEFSLVLTKSSRGESESVKVEVTPSNGKLHVKIAYAIDSD